MSQFAFRILLTTALLHNAYGLYGPNVCNEEQNYTMTTRVKYYQPISIKTYKWCLSIPPKCSSTRTEMKEKWKVQTMIKTKTIEMCCEGFEEDEGRCVPKCPAGFTGDFCDQGCPLERWGPSCAEECECPENSICNVKNGSCVCLEGWFGASCNIPLLPATRMPFPRVDKEVLKNTHLFNWNPPTMADVRTTEGDNVTYKSTIITNSPKIILSTTSNEKDLTKNVNKNTYIRTNVTTEKYNFSTMTYVSTSTETTEISTTTPESENENITIINSVSFNTASKTPKIVTKDIISTKTPVLESVNLNNSTTERINESSVFENIFVENEDANTKTTIIKPVNVSVHKDVVFNESITVTNNMNTENLAESNNGKQITSKSNSVQKSQIESPTLVVLSVTTSSPKVKTTTESVTEVSDKDLSESVSKDSDKLSTTTSKVFTTTTKRKPVKHQKSESEILNITLHSFPSNKDAGSKMFKTITLAPPINSTLKIPHQKGRVLHESKMITIPVRVIMDTEKSPSNIYLKKNVTDIKTIRYKFVTSSPMFTLDVQTEETKHVLTEPEQITSIAGNDDDFEHRDDLLSIMSITIGVMLIIILTATIIVLVTRYKQIRADKLKNMEMDHVQSMMNVSEDEVQSGYLRSVFHSPLPDPPSQIITISKPSFSMPFVQTTLSRPISPALMESFRDILECHYDHPKPPRPTSIPMKIQIVDQLPPSVYQQLHTFRSSSVGANQSRNIPDDFALPVTDAAIDVLKLEHQSSQPVEIENREPVYDEIPPWVSNNPTTNLNKSMYSNDEAITEL